MIGHYAGSFDPPHHGHLDIIRRAAKLCDRLIIGIAVNPDKMPFLPVATRLELLRLLLSDVPNIHIESYTGATITHAQQHGCHVLIRALRTAVDAEYERQLATINRQAADLETILLLADAAHSHLSSSLARQAAGANIPMHYVCPPIVAAAIAARA